MIPKLRNKSYLGVKTLLRLAVQHKYTGDESNKVMFESISSRHPIMGSEHCERDSEEPTLDLFDRVFCSFEPMHWKNSSFVIPHHTWMGHILRRARDILRKGKHLPDDIRKVLGINLHADVLSLYVVGFHASCATEGYIGVSFRTGIGSLQEVGRICALALTRNRIFLQPLKSPGSTASSLPRLANPPRSRIRSTVP